MLTTVFDRILLQFCRDEISGPGGFDRKASSTRGGTRTRMPLRAEAFEASVSTIPPPGRKNKMRKKDHST